MREYSILKGGETRQFIPIYQWYIEYIAFIVKSSGIF